MIYTAVTMKFQILSALFFISTLSVSKASLFGYFFENFENKIPSSIGTKAHKKSTFQTVRGKASIVHLEETGSTQILELEKSDPYTSVFLDASEFAIYDEVYCEVLVKPTAMNDSQDEEFLDFGGAILGFFHHEDSAEIQVLSSKNENESVWISTGIHYALNEERRPQDWIQIRIRINLSTNRWSLALDDKWVLNGLKALDLTSEIALPLFLYGHLNSSNQFDDLLLTNVNPSQLGETLTQEHVSKNRYGKAEVTNIGDKVVSKIKSNASVRQSIDPLKKVKATGIRIRNVEFALKAGNKVYRAQSDLTSESKEDQSLLV